jgi:hypothetical protein
MNNTIKFLILVIFFSLTSSNLFPQSDVDEKTEEEPSSVWSFFSVIPAVKKSPDQKKWFFTLGGWYTKNIGNTDNMNTNMEASITHNNNISEFLISYMGFYGEAGGTINERKGSGILKFDHYVVPRIEIFFFTLSEYNTPARLRHRNNSGAGLKFIFVKNQLMKLDLSGAPVYQYEEYIGEDSTTDPRWSIRGRIKITPVKKLVFSYTYFYIPEIDDGRTYRLDLDTYVSMEVGKYLFLKMGYLNKYNKKALLGTKKTDETYYAQLSVKV